MTGFSDIAKAYENYQTLGSWKDVTYGLIYTCNAGWLDFGHLNPYNDRPEIGAANLWAAVKNGGPFVRSTACVLADSSVYYRGYSLDKRYLQQSYNREFYFRFPDGQKGYSVRYRQDHEDYPLLGMPGFECSFIVKSGLTLDQKKAVALAIFMNVSWGFEKFQERWLSFKTDSGFSQEDLVSNLIGFYIAVGEVTKEEAIRLAHPVSRATAEAIWNQQGAVGGNKNRTFHPQFLEGSAQTVLGDECAGQSKQFPAQFQRIQPAQEGQWYQSMAPGPTFIF